MKDKIYTKIAWLLPQRLVYWAFIRFWSSVTTFEEGAHMTPDQITFSLAIDLWNRRHQKKTELSKAYCECGHEVLQDPKSKVYEGGSTTNIICSNCGVQTNWDLDAPVPLFIKSIK
jgi:hypothetical protein